MTGRRRICVVTGSRADYGLLRPVMAAVRASSRLALQVAATGMHPSPEFGLTRRTIAADGFAIDATVEMLLSSDTPVGIAKSIGLGTIGFADALARLDPDVLVVPGDRFEVLAAVQAALVARVPVAHIFGGDTTEGAIDESIRHALTKMAHLHFVATAEAARRVRQLGENPERIHHTGNPALDDALRTPLLDRDELEAELGFAFRARNALVTFHPATLDERPPAEDFAEVLAALDGFGNGLGIVLTLPNADTHGRALIGMIERFVAARPNAVARTSLGQTLYWSILDRVDAMVGNSSSGLLEAPSFRTPAVNVGDRQKGRVRAASVIDCVPERTAIRAGLERAFAMDCSGVVNPYGDGRAAERIVAVLESLDDPRKLIRKPFFDLPAGGGAAGWAPTASG